MATSDKAALDRLNAAIRDAGGPAAIARARVTSEAKSGDELTDLDNALRAAGGASAPTTAGSSPLTKPLGTQPLKAALRGQFADSAAEPAPPGAKPTVTKLGLDAALREASGRTSKPAFPAGKPRVEPKRSAGLNQALREVDLPEHAPPAETSERQLSRRLVVVLAVTLLGMGSAALWLSQSRLSGPTATLHDLAGAVEQYRREHNGQLPESLTSLEAFPAGAIEWPMRYWLARDAAGRTEIFWAPQGSKHYRIILRQGSSVWVYNDKDRQSRLAKQGAQ